MKIKFVIVLVFTLIALSIFLVSAEAPFIDRISSKVANCSGCSYEEHCVPIGTFINPNSYCVGNETWSGHPYQNITKNMTYGQCVSDAAKLKNDCYKEGKNKGELCINNSEMAKRPKDVTKQCKVDYKSDIKACKQNFKDAKKTCIQETKPNFWQKMRYSMK